MIVLANRFLGIFLLDVLSATVDLIIMLNNPKFLNSKARLKLARQTDIEMTIREKFSESSLTSDKSFEKSARQTTSILINSSLDNKSTSSNNCGNINQTH